MDDNENNMSMRNQKNTAHNSSRGTSRPVNIDDIPVGTSKAKTFEELLESNLRQYEINDDTDSASGNNRSKNHKK